MKKWPTRCHAPPALRGPREGAMVRDIFFQACSGPRYSNTLVPVQDVPNPNPNPYINPVQNVPNPNPLTLTPNPNHNPNPNPNINPNPNPDPNSRTGTCVEKQNSRPDQPSFCLLIRYTFHFLHPEICRGKSRTVYPVTTL